MLFSWLIFGSHPIFIYYSYFHIELFIFLFNLFRLLYYRHSNISFSFFQFSFFHSTFVAFQKQNCDYLHNFGLVYLHLCWVEWKNRKEKKKLPGGRTLLCCAVSIGIFSQISCALECIVREIQFSSLWCATVQFSSQVEEGNLSIFSHK